MSPALPGEVSVPCGAPIISAREVVFTYGSTVVLEKANVNIHGGTLTAITGPSGAGKSTLLQLLAGIKVPTSGSVLYRGAALSGLRASQRARVRLTNFGFVFQFGELLPELTIRENVELPLLLQGVKRSSARSMAKEALLQVDLGEEQARYPHQVSGGQQQRAAVARALIAAPPVVFADEPTGSLDQANADHVMDLLLAQAEKCGTTIVLVTHSPKIAQRCTHHLRIRDRVIGEHVLT